MEAHLRALLRDVLCGYLDTDLKSVADDILLETAPEPFALDEERDSELRVEARDLRRPEPEPEPDRSPRPGPEPEPRARGREPEPEPVAVHHLDGVTESADWACDQFRGLLGARLELRAPSARRPRKRPLEQELPSRSTPSTVKPQAS